MPILKPSDIFAFVRPNGKSRVWYADRGRLLLRTPGHAPLGIPYVLFVETNPFSELVVTFQDYALRISLGTFTILLFTKLAIYSEIYEWRLSSKLLKKVHIMEHLKSSFRKCYGRYGDLLTKC